MEDLRYMHKIADASQIFFFPFGERFEETIATFL